MATLQLVCTTMSVCDPYRELELYLEQANSDITEVFNKWAREGRRRCSQHLSDRVASDNKINNDFSCLSPTPAYTDTQDLSPQSVPSTVLTSTSSSTDNDISSTLQNSSSTWANPQSVLITITSSYDENDTENIDNENEYPQSVEDERTGLSQEFDSVLEDLDLEEYTNHFNREFEIQSPRTICGQRTYLPYVPYEYTAYPFTGKCLITIYEHLDKYDQLQDDDINSAAQQLFGALFTGELTHLVSFATLDNGYCSSETDIFSKEADLALGRAISEGEVAGGFSQSHTPFDKKTLLQWEMLRNTIKRIVPWTSSSKVNRQQLVQVQELRDSLLQSILHDIEATEACRWLRAAGFPQYAQLYESNQFPVEISAVEQDHPQLEASVLASLFRRLHVLNRCARLHQQKNSQQQSDWDDEECALSANWIYQSDVRRWSRVGRDLEIPEVGSKEWHKLNSVMKGAVVDTCDTDTSPLSVTFTTPPLRERDSSFQQQQPKVLRAGSVKIRRRTMNRDPFESPPISASNSSNNSAAPSPAAVSVLDLLSQQLRSLNSSQINVNEVGQQGESSQASSTISLAIGDPEGGLPRSSRRSKTRSLDKCDIPGMLSSLPTEKHSTSRFGIDILLAGLKPSSHFSLRSAWQSQARAAAAAAAADVLEERLELEEGGRPMATLSCTQLHVLRKLALLKLTAYMERFCPAHRTGWNWDLPKVLLRKSKVPQFKDNSIFGVPISTTLQRTGYPLPKAIEMALDWLAENGRDQVGIFRRSGVKSRITALRALMEERGDTIEFNAFQSYDIADMVKQYFRELPDAVMTNKLSETFILIIQHVPVNLRRESFLCAILLMPDEHTEVLQILLTFLRDLAKFSEDHQMTTNNLALCFAPSLFHYQQVPSSRQNLGQPHSKEVTESYAALDCLAYMLDNYDNVFSIPKELLQQCKGDEIKESTVLHWNQLGADCNGNWRSYLQECQNALMREVREKNRGWLAVQPHYPRIELAYKKVADGHPLRLWKISAEIEAPPVEVLHRILRERHVWDDDLQSMRIVEIIEPNTEVHQYHRRNVKPLPVEDYCVIRMWKSDLPKGACVVVETSVEHQDATVVPNSVRSIVLASRYLIEPCGSGRSKVVHLVRVDTRGRMPEWFQKNYGHVCSIFLTNLQNSFRRSAAGPESRV